MIRGSGVRIPGPFFVFFILGILIEDGSSPQLISGGL